MAENSYKLSWGWGEQGLPKAAPEQPFLLWPELGTSQQCGPGDAPPSAESAGVMPDLQPHIHRNTCSSPSGFWLRRLETGWTEAAGESEGKPHQCWLHRAGSCCPIRCSSLSLQCDISKSRAKCTESRTWSYCFRLPLGASFQDCFLKTKIDALVQPKMLSSDHRHDFNT